MSGGIYSCPFAGQFFLQQSPGALEIHFNGSVGYSSGPFTMVSYCNCEIFLDRSEIKLSDMHYFLGPANSVIIRLLWMAGDSLQCTSDTLWFYGEDHTPYWSSLLDILEWYYMRWEVVCDVCCSVPFCLQAIVPCMVRSSHFTQRDLWKVLKISLRGNLRYQD